MSWTIITHIDSGPIASRPAAAAVPGRHYGWWATDTKVLSISDGSTWTDIGPGGTGVTYGTPAVVLGTAAAAGSTDEAIRRDSTIVAFDATVPSTQAFGDSAAAGSAAVAARRDHKHAMPATPTSVSGNAGTATALQTSRNIDGQSFNGTADITVIAPGTHAATGKTTPVDADEVPLVDSAASNVLKKLTWANVKATLKTYFDTLYSATGAYAPGGTDVAVADGGTGASTAATARSNLGIAGAVGGLEWTSIVKGGDTSVASSATLAADPDLQFTGVSGAVYEIEAIPVYASPAGGGTPDIKLTFAEDGTTRGIHLNVGLDGGDFGASSATGNSTAFSSTRGTATGNRACLMTGTYFSGGGTVAVYWAQGTSGTNATIMRAGSILRYRRLV